MTAWSTSRLLFAASFCMALLACGGGSSGSHSTADSQRQQPQATSPEVAQALPVYRFAKLSNGAYFYTGNEAEKDFVLREVPDLRYEGLAFGRTADGSGDPIYRFANLANGGYFYTANTAERDLVIQTRRDMRYEGSSFAVAGAAKAGALPVFRLANLVNGAYLYTVNPQERDLAVATNIWRYEGVAFHAEIATQPGGNIAPTAVAGVAQNVLVGATVLLDGSASKDLDGDPLTYSWKLTGKPAGSSAALLAASSAKPTFVADLSGSYLLSLTVSDGKVTSATATVTVTATTANAVPVADAGDDQSVLAKTTVYLDGHGSTDANGDALTYFWTLSSKPAGSTATLNGGSTATPTLMPDLAGSYVVNLVVHDGKASSTSASVKITAATANAAPVAYAGGSQSVTTGATVFLSGAGSSDANGDALTFIWSLISRPSGSSTGLSSLSSATPFFTADVAGTYVVSLVVNDGKVASAASTMTVTAAGTTAPPRTCCRVCTTGKACGDSCIARTSNCSRGSGCAC